MKASKGLARGFKASVALGALALGFGAAAPAMAQDSGVEEIIVVAQRRAENIQDVPISVTALSTEQLDTILSGGGDVLQLSARVPGVNVESSNGRVAPRFYIRGLGNTDFDLAASQPVSIIMDDVVMENVALKSFPLFDIAQVEVLRGPQGTLFGRNTPAGIISFRSVRPSEDFDAHVNASYGTYGSSSLEAAIGGGLAPGLSARGSLFMSHRDDWIDNTFTGEEIGGFDELAGRVQVLWSPTAAFDALLNLHARSNEGTATVFRGLVLPTGSNQLSDDFERDKVALNAGDGNPQEYDSEGAALTLSYDFGGVVLTSITGYDTAEGFSQGDIDGTDSGFDATRDALKDLTQLTQELRLASDYAGPFSWQVGAYYFDSEFGVETSDPSGVLAVIEQENTSWAVFGQGTYQVSDKLKLIAGIRYTEDEKDMTPVLTQVAQGPISLSDDEVSWDVSAVYEATPDLNLYARVATGFRAPSIQARDLGFFFSNGASTAASETILSYEIGFKADVLNGTGRINGDVYYYTVEDQQFTAVGGAGNFVQLTNADEGVGYGFEIDAVFEVTETFSVNGGFAYTHTEINDPNLLVGGCSGGSCTVLDQPSGGFFIADGNKFPNAPEFTMNLGGRYEHALASGLLFVETDWAFKGPTNFFLYDSVEYETDTQFEAGAKIGYAFGEGAYEVAVFGRNITDEENIIGGIDFLGGGNNVVFVNEPRIIGVSLSARY